MPTNKNAQLRYQILDRCFSDFKRRYTIDDLLETVNDGLFNLGLSVELRQIRDDIKYMREFGTFNAPIKAYPFDGKKCYYRYEDDDFSIFNNQLSVEDVNTLRSAIDMLGKYRGAASNAWLEEVISNLEYRFGVKSNNNNVVGFEQDSQLKGIEFLSDLIDSVVNHTTLQIIYRTYKGNEKASIVHPYHLKQYNNRWFLFGLEENEKYGNQITNKPLDRIVSFSQVSGVSFIPNKDIDFSSYFKDIIGVTIPSDHPEPEEVLMKFDAARFPYIVSKPIHPSQKIINEEERIISIFVRPNKELEAQIFYFGPQVEIIEPIWLRNEIKEKIVSTLKNYTSIHNDCTDV